MLSLGLVQLTSGVSVPSTSSNTSKTDSAVSPDSSVISSGSKETIGEVKSGAMIVAVRIALALFTAASVATAVHILIVSVAIPCSLT